MDERIYWLGFSVFPGIGPQKFSLLYTHFGSVKKAWQASKEDLRVLLGDALTEKFLFFRDKFSPDLYVKRLQEKQVSFFVKTDVEYPELLRQIKNPPIVLYVKGNLAVLSKKPCCIAIVGTRKVTQYGREVTEMFTKELVAKGFTIISGLAMGVDTVAHKTTLAYGGKTVAVLGCGVDCCFPKENFSLYSDIIKGGGAIVSEFPLGFAPTRGSFPSRNRIIAGLSLGVVVTEGAEDSGSLITADYAFKNNRKVFAVPGPITSSLSKGPYKLLKKGGILVTSADDILKEFKMQNAKIKITTKNSKLMGDITKEEQEILELLGNEPLHFDEIVRKLKKSSSEVGSLLSIMEVKGIIKNLDSGMFCLVS